MKQLISFLEKQVKNQISIGKANIVRLESFDNPLIYKAICDSLKHDERISKLILKLSNEKYMEYKTESREGWDYAIRYLHQGFNAEYSDNMTEAYIDKSFIDFNNALTKWRNELATVEEGETALLLLMGSEAAPDTGGLVDTSYAITPKRIIAELKDNYSLWFASVLEDNGIDGTDSNKAINTLYKALFNNINIDLVKLSNFIDSLGDLSFASIQDLIAHICETMNDTWEIPSVIDYKYVPKAQNLSKGALKSAKIVTDAINFIERTEDIPSQAAIAKLEKKFDKFAEDNGIVVSDPFPKMDCVFENYKGFEKTVLEFMSGKDVEINRQRLLKIDFAYISRIIGTPLKREPKIKAVLVSGEPLEAYGKMAFNTMAQFKESHTSLPDEIKFRVDHISLSDCTDEQKEDSYMHICNYMGGILRFVNDIGLSFEDQTISFIYDSNIDPFEYTNYDEFSNKIRCSGKWGDPCKISFTLIASGDNEEEKYEFKWAFSPNSSWLNAFSYLGNVLYRGGDSYILPTIVVCRNIQDFLNCESEDDFYAQLSQIREDILFDQHRAELRKYFKDTESLAFFDSLCAEFKTFAISLTEKGLFNSLEPLRKVVDTYTKMMDSTYSLFDSFSDVQREKMPLLVNCFTITSNEEIINTGEMKEVIVPAYNPILLEKIDAKVLFIRAGLGEIISKFTSKLSTYGADIENLIQLSSITQAMDTINHSGSNYLTCKNMWEFYAVYYDGTNDVENVSGNSFGSSIVTDDEDASAMLHISPMSNIVVRNILDYIRTFPARIDGLKVAFVGPEDMQHIVAAVHSIAKKLEKAEIEATINIEIICVNSKKNSTSYLRKWLDSYFSDERCVNINTYLRNAVIISKDDVETLRVLLKDHDLCFNYDVLGTVGVDFEPSTEGDFDKDSIKFPMTFTPDTIPATHGKSRKVCISQYQFLASKAQTQISQLAGNPHTVKRVYKAFKKLELSEISSKMIEISHECCKWVVCIDPAIDRHMLESNKSKIIGFTTGEGSYGELNVTVSARKDILADIKQMLKKRITEKFSNWDDNRLQEASDYCVDYLSRYMDGSRILKALNPYDYEIHSFLAYLLTLQMLELPEKNDKYLLRSLISLDSYKHWFSEDDTLNVDNKRPDFMLIEIPNTQDNLSADKKLHLNVKIIECKMGYKSEGHLSKAQTQLEKGIKTMSYNWNPNNTDIMHRYWLNQLYRAIIFTQLDMDNTAPEYSIIRDKIYGILQGKYEISWTGDIFAFWLDSNSEIPDEWTIDSAELDRISDIDLGELVCHNCGQMFIQKMLLPSDKRNEQFDYNEIIDPNTDQSGWNEEDEEEDNTANSEQNVNIGDGHTIPKTPEVLMPFLRHLNDGTVHSRRDDLKWFESFFKIDPQDKHVLYDSNNHPKWETVLDFAISELRREAIIENTEYGSYALTDFGNIVADNESQKSDDESFTRFVMRIKEAAKKEDEDKNINNPTTEEKDVPPITEDNESPSESNTNETAGVQGVRLLLGEDIRTKEKYYWEFGNKNLNNRHLLINGNSGCGKTYCIQGLLMEAAQQGVSSVVFDYTGGFTNSKLDPIFKERLGDRIKQRIVKISKIPVNPFEKNEIQIDEDIFVPEEDADVADKISEIFKAVYDLGDQQKSAVYSAVLNGLREHGSNMSFPIMVEELENLGTNYAKTVISKIQAFSDFNPFAVDDTFSWSEIRDSEGMVYVFQLTGYGRDIQVLLTELLLWDIWNYCVKNGDESKPFILVMDEAQNLSHGEKSPSAKILTEGRKFGISGWYATQFMKPQLSDDEIQRLQQAGQKLYFCPPDDGVMTVAKNIDITSQGAKDWADRLKKLKKGECVTCGNMVRNGKWSKYEPRIVKISSLNEREING